MKRVFSSLVQPPTNATATTIGSKGAKLHKSGDVPQSVVIPRNRKRSKSLKNVYAPFVNPAERNVDVGDFLFVVDKEYKGSRIAHVTASANGIEDTKKLIPYGFSEQDFDPSKPVSASATAQVRGIRTTFNRGWTTTFPGASMYFTPYHYKAAGTRTSVHRERGECPTKASPPFFTIEVDNLHAMVNHVTDLATDFCSEHVAAKLDAFQEFKDAKTNDAKRAAVKRLIETPRFWKTLATTVNAQVKAKMEEFNVPWSLVEPISNACIYACEGQFGSYFIADDDIADAIKSTSKLLKRWVSLGMEPMAAIQSWKQDHYIGKAMTTSRPNTGYEILR